MPQVTIRRPFGGLDLYGNRAIGSSGGLECFKLLERLTTFALPRE
jgi:hypothetical protein